MAAARGLPKTDALRPQLAPSGFLGSLHIALRNTMSTATGTYQQLVRIDSTKFSDLINSNWTNGVPYYAANGTPVYGWLEANASNASANTLLWLKVASIPANGWTNVSIGFGPKDWFNLSATGYFGEAPELSSTYGEFDNGAKVFNFYDNFSGNTLSSLWKVDGTWEYKVNNGFSINATPGGGTGIVSNTTFAYPAVEDFYGNFYQSHPTAWVDMGWGTPGCAGQGDSSAIGWGSGSSPWPGSAYRERKFDHQWNYRILDTAIRRLYLGGDQLELDEHDGQL